MTNSLEYFRWSDDGTYFIVPDKAGLMERVIPDLFNQNSYSSFVSRDYEVAKPLS